MGRNHKPARMHHAPRMQPIMESVVIIIDMCCKEKPDKCFHLYLETFDQTTVVKHGERSIDLPCQVCMLLCLYNMYVCMCVCVFMHSQTL